MFFENLDFNTWLKIGLFTGGFLHFFVVVWVAKDIFHRSKSIIFQIISLIIVFFLPLYGLLLYILIRPYDTISEKTIKNLYLYMKLFECSECGAFNKDEFKYCHSCGADLKKQKKCSACKKNYNYYFNYCPFCKQKNGND